MLHTLSRRAFAAGAIFLLLQPVMLAGAEAPAELKVIAPADPPAAASGVDDRIDVSALPGLDENRFLRYVVVKEYRDRPSDVLNDAAGTLAACEMSRERLKRVKAIAAARPIDPGILEMGEGLGKLLDDYETCLVDLRRIDETAKQRARDNASNAALRGLDVWARRLAASQAAGNLNDQAKTDALFGGGKAAMDAFNAGKSADAALIAQVRQRLDAMEKEAYASLEQSEKKMAARLHWPSPLSMHRPTGNAKGMYLKGEEIDPRDPFVDLEIAADLLKQVDDRVPTIDDRLSAVFHYLMAARLVPPDAAYASYRGEFLHGAAFVACHAAEAPTEEAYGKNMNDGAGKAAVSTARALLAADPSDTSGQGRMLLARSLYAAGHCTQANDVDHALIAELGEKCKADAEFDYHCARLSGLYGAPDEAAGWLRLAYQNGFNDVKRVSRCADFDCLRSKMPDAYRQLTTVAVRASVNDGKLVVTNDSPFTLDGAEIAWRAVAGAKIWKVDVPLWLELRRVVQPGETVQIPLMPGTFPEGDDELNAKKTWTAKTLQGDDDSSSSRGQIK